MPRPATPFTTRSTPSSLPPRLRALGVETVIVDSAAADRPTFLQRPDLGGGLTRIPNSGCESTALAEVLADLAIIVSDGLSALAVHRQAPPLLATLLPKLKPTTGASRPIVIARFGRVALEDQIGQLLGAQLALMLIGERPGLGSPDSLGAYLVYAPRVGNTDANRNCVSNIRPEGLPFEAAADNDPLPAHRSTPPPTERRSAQG